MRRFRVHPGVVASLLAGALLVGCGSSSGGAGAGSGLGDGLLKRGVGVFAEGTWRCENVEADEYEGAPASPGRKVTATIRIARDGRFSVDSDGGLVDGAGTWTVDGLKLRLAVPWSDDGDNGFYRYLLRADQDPPTRLQGGSTDRQDSVQDLKVSIHEDRITLSQKDAEAFPDRSKPNYSWDVDCRRQSHDPGTIPPTVPPSSGAD